MKKTRVISLGGSLIIPDKINTPFLKSLRQVILKNIKNNKFIIICGGGTVARNYIDALAEDKKSIYLQSLIGISSTRINARFMSYFFGIDPKKGIPRDMKHVESLLRQNDIVFCGGLRYAPNQTSDATAVRLANYFNTDFINLTNVKGLYDKNPFKYKDAKFISKATINDLEKAVKKISNKPGMHGPVDYTAMHLIKENKIKTYIIGKDTRQLDNLLNGKDFIGTTIG
jgi:uridylate kinase